MSSGAPAIVVEGVSKSFLRPHEQMHTFKERALHPFRGRSFDRLDAVRDVSFAVEQGEFFGIVGRNGSGKSTLLKLIAGIYQASSGEIWVNGRMSTFIELGVGFNPDLAARDNVILNGIMLGLTPVEARERYEQVIDFAELREFETVKLKNYSSGMHVRLAFSVMIQVDADVLLIDEVLAVGDASFQQKCFDQFNRLRDAGRTIVLVTHDMGAVRRFCHRAMLMEHGATIVSGDPERVGSHYLELNFHHDQEEAAAVPLEGKRALRRRDGAVRAALDADGGRAAARGRAAGRGHRRQGQRRVQRRAGRPGRGAHDRGRGPPARVRRELDLGRGAHRLVPGGRSRHPDGAVPERARARPVPHHPADRAPRLGVRPGRPPPADDLVPGDRHARHGRHRGARPRSQLRTHERQPPKYRRSELSGRADPCRRRHTDARAERRHRRRAAHAEPDLDAGVPGVPAEVLRVGPGLPVAARPAADAVRRLLRRLHAVRPPRGGREVLPADAARRDHALPVLLRDDGGSPCRPCSPARTWSARSTSRAS